MLLPPGLLSLEAVRVAVDAELDGPPRLLPPSSVHPALLARREDFAAWAFGRVQGEFVPSAEVTVAASKAGHGVRPVAVWDLPSRLTYWALADRLRPALPPVDRGHGAYRAFQRAPSETGAKYVVSSDIAACYQFVDHALLASELLTQTGEAATVSALISLLRETGGRTYGLPQQSPVSDLLAEAFLRRLERALVRRGLKVWRYNDDFRFACRSWSEVVRSIEVLADESRAVGLTVNDLKTVTWTAGKYTANLDRAEALRTEIAAEAELDLTQFETDYDGIVVAAPPDRGDVDALAAIRVLERWDKIAGRGLTTQANRPEHRAVVELLPAALKTLEADAATDPDVLALCMKVLRYERTATPAVASYLVTKNDEAAVVGAFDKLLAAKAYLNGWQVWWLQQPVARHAGFASGPGSKARRAWAVDALTVAEHSPVLRAHAALTLARLGMLDSAELLSLYDRTNATLQPVIAAAIALCRPAADVAAAVRGDSLLHAWAYDWASLHA